MARLGKRKTTERSKTHSRRHFSCDQCRRTSGSGGRAAGAAGKTCRPRQCHGRHRLRLRPRTVCAARPSVNHVGKAAIAGGRGPARLEAALAASCNGLNAQLGARGFLNSVDRSPSPVFLELIHFDQWTATCPSPWPSRDPMRGSHRLPPGREAHLPRPRCR